MEMYEREGKREALEQCATYNGLTDATSLIGRGVENSWRKMTKQKNESKLREKQANDCGGMEKDVEEIVDGLKRKLHAGIRSRKSVCSDAESGLKDQDARLKKLEGGLDSFQRVLLETKGSCRAQCPDERWTAVPEGRGRGSSAVKTGSAVAREQLRRQALTI